MVEHKDSWIARSLATLAADRAEAGDEQGSLAAAERLLDSATSVRAAVSGAMVNLADHLARTGRADESKSAADRLIAMFGADDDASIRLSVDRARAEAEAREPEPDEADGPHTLSEFFGGG